MGDDTTEEGLAEVAQEPKVEEGLANCNREDAEETEQEKGDVTGRVEVKNEERDDRVEDNEERQPSVDEAEADGNDDRSGEKATVRFEDDVEVEEGREDKGVDGDGDSKDDEEKTRENDDDEKNEDDGDLNQNGGGGKSDIKDGDVGDSESVKDLQDDVENEDADIHDQNVTTCSKTDDKDVAVNGERSALKSASRKSSTDGNKKVKTVRVRSSKTVSSIEVDMTRIIHEREIDSDDEYDDAVTRVTCTKSVDFSIPVDEVEAELQRVIERPGSGRTSMMDNEDMLGVGRAATMNTPVTNDDRESFIYTRNIQTPSRDGIYQHALNLINNRCRSQTYSSRSQPVARRRSRDVRQPPPRSAVSLPATLLGGVPMFKLPNVVEHINKEPFMDQPNSFFYIAQDKPLPMKPMKVWKGYRGNVYFEPMVCRSAPLTPQSCAISPAERMKTSRFPSISKSANASLGRTEGNDGNGNSVHYVPKSATTTRSQPINGRRTAASGSKSAMSTRSGNARQLAILDKSTVLDRMDYNTAEDIRWISGIESTGTLQIGPTGEQLTGRAYKFFRNGGKHPKLRIRRGLVSHSLAVSNKNSPKLGVKGGGINDDQPATNHLANQNQINHPSRRTSVHDPSAMRGSYSNDKYHCVDSMTALQQIMKRNDGKGRSKLVHILPSAYSNTHDVAMRAKGKL